ncbi:MULTISPECIES: DUF4254 domain-containing protein [unclassified Nocardia]|uniref:DUF4254 domain-containing protein n=1 Tax=unclassified Nocardia TaxID=2637762 RepID=UPI00278C2C9D|nr:MULTISPECIES: DUF4254 domain-containing protein [unclassified Nocardia]
MDDSDPDPTVRTAAFGCRGLRLPTGEELVASLHGGRPGDHVLVRCFRQLAACHRRRLSSTPNEQTVAAGERRARIIRLIDQWADRSLPRSGESARLHTETLASVVDRLALAHEQAWRTLMTAGDPAAPVVHARWRHLAELVDAYRDLTEQVAAGQRQLPRGR